MPTPVSDKAFSDRSTLVSSPSIYHSPQLKHCREKILVTVRVRPLSDREVAHHDNSAWDCIDSRTITFKQPFPDRSPHSKSYTFDRVFGPESTTQRVYEEGAKTVALSALAGVNATIFAYGQTTSGKTFTMKGITMNAIQDIFSHIKQHNERDFMIKVSAIEIYNEVVRDLIKADSGPLRLMDDPEKGTIVERLVELNVKESNHLKDVLSLVEAQRQVGETMLNDTSSRSHQIVRLTIESSFRDVEEGSFKDSLIATLNLVDLAGSERASQTLSEGMRLKEGCHINRSLLTLTTIIRKLSEQGRGKDGHLPYRDSKLTRILQNSLGGNSRTAIICTMSPARSHVEQSRNTLFFATQAKEVTNIAHVNVVVSEKVLVKQLQKEVARLEAELKGPDIAPLGLPDAETLLQEKDAQIEQLQAAMRELHVERDLAQARLDELLKKIADDEAARESKNVEASLLAPETMAKSTDDDEGQHIVRRLQQPTSASLMLVQEIRKLEQLQDELGEDASKALEALQKEVECLRLAQMGMNQDAAATIAKLQAEIKNLHLIKTTSDDVDNKNIVAPNLSTSWKEEINRLQSLGDADRSVADNTIATLEEQLEIVQSSIDNLIINSEIPAKEMKVRTPTSCRIRRPKTPLSAGNINTLQETCMDSIRSPHPKQSLVFDSRENNPPNTRNSKSSLLTCKQMPSKKKQDVQKCISTTEDTSTYQQHNFMDIMRMQTIFKTAAEENIQSIRTYVRKLKERVAKLQYQKQLLVCQVLELEANTGDLEGDNDLDLISIDGRIPTAARSLENWQSSFQKRRMHIVELWDGCHVSIIHRSQFYLLFKGDPADEVYVEVELRRLTWLKQNFGKIGSTNAERGVEEDDLAITLAASCETLKRERDQLAKKMRMRFTEEEREDIYREWGVELESKQRKLQFTYKIWTNTQDWRHIEESALLVARIERFWELGKAASKEMFELAFTPPRSRRPWLQLSWNNIMNNLTK